MPYANKEKQKAFQRKWKRNRKEGLQKLKSGPCTDCNQTFPPVAMEWDHISNNKFLAVSKMSQYSLERSRKEIAKCELVCSNCHKIRTWNRIVNKLK